MVVLVISEQQMPVTVDCYPRLLKSKLISNLLVDSYNIDQTVVNSNNLNVTTISTTTTSNISVLVDAVIPIPDSFTVEAVSSYHKSWLLTGEVNFNVISNNSMANIMANIDNTRVQQLGASLRLANWLEDDDYMQALIQLVIESWLQMQPMIRQLLFDELSDDIIRTISLQLPHAVLPDRLRHNANFIKLWLDFNVAKFCTGGRGPQGNSSDNSDRNRYDDEWTMELAGVKFPTYVRNFSFGGRRRYGGSSGLTESLSCRYDSYDIGCWCEVVTDVTDASYLNDDVMVNYPSTDQDDSQTTDQADSQTTVNKLDDCFLSLVTRYRRYVDPNSVPDPDAYSGFSASKYTPDTKLTTIARESFEVTAYTFTNKYRMSLGPYKEWYEAGGLSHQSYYQHEYLGISHNEPISHADRRRRRTYKSYLHGPSVNYRNDGSVENETVYHRGKVVSKFSSPATVS